MKNKMKQCYQQLQMYGYHFSWKKILLSYAVIAIGTIGIGYLFRMQGLYLGILCFAILAWSPYFIRNLYANGYEQRRFTDVNIYMEQFLYSFQKSGKIQTTLEDILKLFPTGQMHKVLEEAIEHIKHTFDEEDVALHALEMVEKEYPMKQMQSMHRFAHQVEKNGGEYTQVILLMLDARRMWADRFMELAKAKAYKRTQIVISTFISIGLCYLLMSVSRSVELDIANWQITQISTLLLLFLDICILYAADRKLLVHFEEKEVDQKKLLADYQYVKNDGKKKKNRFIFGRLVSRVKKKKVQRGIMEVFPQWLMDVSLLLQTENVQVALQKSYEDAPLLLKAELKELLQELQQHPTDMEPYLLFLGDFATPEIQTSMRMLYSISEGTGGNATNQIADIIRRNQQLMDQAERLKNEDALAGLYTLFLAPQLTSGAKMLLDMMVMFLSLLSTSMTLG